MGLVRRRQGKTALLRSRQEGDRGQRGQKALWEVDDACRLMGCGVGGAQEKKKRWGWRKIGGDDAQRQKFSSDPP